MPVRFCSFIINGAVAQVLPRCLATEKAVRRPPWGLKSRSGVGGGCTADAHGDTGDDECPATSFSFLPLPGGRPRLRGPTTLASSSSSCVMPSSKPTYTFLVPSRRGRWMDAAASIFHGTARWQRRPAIGWGGCVHHILRSNAESYSNCVCGSFFDVTSLQATGPPVKLLGRGILSYVRDVCSHTLSRPNRLACSPLRRPDDVARRYNDLQSTAQVCSFPAIIY